MDYNALEKMTVNQLREEANKIPDAKGITGMKKNELVALLVAHHGLTAPEKKTVEKKPERTLPDKSSIKKKIKEIKQQRDKARADNDRKAVKILRRRIHALKRRARRAA